MSTTTIDRKSLAARIHQNTATFYRTLTALVFTARKVFIGSYSADEQDKDKQDEIPEGVPFAKLVLAEGLEAHVYWGNVTDADHSLMSEGVNRKTVELPADGHIGWKTAALPTGQASVRMKIDGQPFDLNMPSSNFRVQDVQIVRLGNRQVAVHLFDGDAVLQGMIDPSKLAPCQWDTIATGIASLLTLPGENKPNILFAKKGTPGLINDESVLPNTKPHGTIATISKHSEAQHVYYRTTNGRIFGMTYNVVGKNLKFSAPATADDRIAADHNTCLLGGFDVGDDAVFAATVSRTGDTNTLTGRTLRLAS